MVRKVTLIPDWKQAWKYASVRFQAVGLFLMAAAEVIGSSWSIIPPSVQALLPKASVVAAIIFGLGLIGRVLTREAKDNAAK